MKCPRCGKDNPPDLHTCTPIAMRYVDELRRHGTVIDHVGCAAEIVRLYEENVRVTEALQALYDTAPRAECSDFHHPKKDRHEVGAHCPVLERYENACLKARAALARAGEVK